MLPCRQDTNFIENFILQAESKYFSVCHHCFSILRLLLSYTNFYMIYAVY